MSEAVDLRALDEEWANLSGSHSISPHQYSSNPMLCFGPGGPWEWLVANDGLPQLATQPEQGDLISQPRDNIRYLAFCGRRFRERGLGDTPFEAITRCAIEARKKLDPRQ